MNGTKCFIWKGSNKQLDLSYLPYSCWKYVSYQATALLAQRFVVHRGHQYGQLIFLKGDTLWLSLKSFTYHYIDQNIVNLLIMHLWALRLWSWQWVEWQKDKRREGSTSQNYLSGDSTPYCFYLIIFKDIYVYIHRYFHRLDLKVLFSVQHVSMA